VKQELERLAERLAGGKVSPEQYEEEVDRILGTGLPKRDLEKEKAWERQRRGSSSSSS
jgi:hypothetical protein